MASGQRTPGVDGWAISIGHRELDAGPAWRYRVSERSKPWKGGIGTLFDGKIQFTQNGAGYISKSDVPKSAIGFWLPSANLELHQDERGKSGYYPKKDYRHLSYVGVQEPIELIQAGQLVRVSLARWWKPQDADADFEERCYAQLSGWF